MSLGYVYNIATNNTNGNEYRPGAAVLVAVAEIRGKIRGQIGTS
jgi:hypothetical protein